jgi:hypothetical protein
MDQPHGALVPCPEDRCQPHHGYSLLNDVIGLHTRRDGVPCVHSLPYDPKQGLEADPRQKDFSAEQPGRQGMHAVDRQQSLQAIAPAGQDNRYPLALAHRPLDVVPQIERRRLREEVEAVLQPGPFVQAGHAHGPWRAVQLPRYARVITGVTPQRHRSARFCVFSSRLHPMVRLPALNTSQQ